MEVAMSIQATVQGPDAHVSINGGSTHLGQQVAEAKRQLMDAYEHQIAAIADRPATAKARQLRRLRTEAERRIAELQQRIEDIKASCIAGGEFNESAIDQAAGELAECERGIASERLAVESLDKLIPEAIKAEEQDVKQAVADIVQGIRDDAKKQRADAERKILAKYKHVVDYAVAVELDAWAMSLRNRMNAEQLQDMLANREAEAVAAG